MLRRSFACSLPRIFFLTLASLPAVSSSAEIGGTTYTVDTTLNDGDVWTGGDVGINDGKVVNIPTGATIGYSPTANRNLTSNTTGTLRIDSGGSFSFATATSGDNLVLSGAVGILNNGTFDLASGGDIQLVNNASSFTNNGLLLKSIAGTDGFSNDPSYIFPNTTTSGGTFLNTGDITVNAGHLNISGGSSTGGNFTTVSGGTLSFSGRWTELTGVADTSGGGSIQINSQNPNSSTGGLFVATAALTRLNVTGTGISLISANLDLNTNTLRNDGTLLMGTGTTTVQGTGTFENNTGALFRFTGGNLVLNSSNLSNNGLIEFASATTSLSGSASVVNNLGATITLSSGGTIKADTALINNGQMNISGNAAISGTVAVTNGATGTLTLVGGTNTAFSLNGNNIVNNGTTEFNVDGNVTLAGTGRFINNVTFNHNFGGNNDNLALTDTVVFENNGTYDFKDRGDISFGSSGASFQNNGLLVKSVAGGDASYVFRNTVGADSNFIAAGGSELRSNAGVLHVASGGTSDAAALWTADGGDLTLAGQWSGTITGSSSNGGKVRITDSGNPSVASDLLIGTGGLIFDVSGDGAVWNQSEIKTQTNTLTNVDTFFIASAATRTLSGGGEFLNASGATLTHQEGTITFAGSSILRNQGTMNLGGGTRTIAYAGTGSVINDAGATASWTGGTIDMVSPAEFHNKGILEITGSNHTLSGDGLFANDLGGVTNWNNASSINIGTGATYTNNGTFNVEESFNRLFTGGGSFVNNGTFNHNIASGDDNIGWNGTGEFVNNGTFAFNSNNDFQMDNGSVFTNSANATLRVNASNSGDPTQFFSNDNNGVGTIDNQGTVEVLAGHFRITTSVGGSQFDDNVLVQNNGSKTLTSGTWVANSSATNTARIDLQPFGLSSGIDTVGAGATVELTGSGAQLVQLSSVTQVDGGLYINEQIFTPGGTLTIGSTGTLGGNGTISSGTVVNGLLTPGSSRGAAIGGISVTGDLAMGSSSQMNLQLGAALGVQDSSFNAVTTRMMIDSMTDMDPTTEHDSVEVSGILTLSNMMSIQVVDAGVTYAYGQYFDLLDFASLDGITTQAEADAILTLPDLGSSYSWDTSLFVSKGIIFVVPEPSQVILLLMGLGGLLLRRKRTS